MTETTVEIDRVALSVLADAANGNAVDTSDETLSACVEMAYDALGYENIGGIEPVEP